MFVIIALLIMMIIYIKEFKSDFTEDHLKKLEPVLTLLLLIFLLLFVFGLIGWQKH